MRGWPFGYSIVKHSAGKSWRSGAPPTAVGRAEGEALIRDGKGPLEHTMKSEFLQIFGGREVKTIPELSRNTLLKEIALALTQVLKLKSST